MIFEYKVCLLHLMSFVYSKRNFTTTWLFVEPVTPLKINAIGYFIFDLLMCFSLKFNVA